jgi:hypothetical protein
MQTQVIQSSERSAEDIAVRAHRKTPCVLIEIQTRHDPGQRSIYRAAFIGALRPARPIDEFQIVAQGERNRQGILTGTEVEQRRDSGDGV